ncbi:hypothetical protein Tco_0644569 [Tanacetum coccineum]
MFLIFKNQRSTQQCTKSGVTKHLGVAVIHQHNVLVKEMNVTLLAKALSEEGKDNKDKSEQNQSKPTKKRKRQDKMGSQINQSRINPIQVNEDPNESSKDQIGQAIQKKEEEKRIAEEQAAEDRYWKILICYDDDDDYTIAITPVLPTKEPVNSLSMGDEHLDTISATESDEVIKSSVENLVPIPSKSKGIPDSMCDVPLCNNPTSLEAFKEHSKTIIDSNDDSTSSDDDSYENIDYVDASPPDAEIVSLEVVEIVIPKVGGIDTDILLTIKDDILREKLLNVNLLIANIEALKDNPAPSSMDYEAFYSAVDHIEEKTMSRIFEASRARGICPSITRASQSSASFGNPDILILSTNVYL